MKNNQRDWVEFCAVIESIFLHGLKHSFLSIGKNFFDFGSDVDKKPEPSFWPALLVISHRDVIQTINKSKQLQSEVGYCRAWIRLSLNDGLISAYLTAIQGHKSSLASYYYKHAFLRDVATTELAVKILQGIESKITFNMPFNSTLLNEWPLMALDLAGIWSVALKNLPIEHADDVAGSLPKNYNHEYRELCTKYGLETTCSTPAEEASDADETFEAIEDKTYEDRTFDGTFDEPQFHLETQDMTLSLTLEDQSSATLSPKVSPITDEEHEDYNRLNSIDEMNFEALVSRYKDEKAESNEKQAPGIKEVWDRFENHLQLVSDVPDTEWEKMDPDTPVSSKRFKLNELQSLVEQLCRLGNESGLDAQEYRCHGCTNPIGIDFRNAQICRFSGNYYCNQCMSTETFIIPSRAIYNWDFKRYPVSEKAATFFKEFQYEPFIDLNVLNPDYTYIRVMRRYYSLRRQLCGMGTFMVTCEVANEFKEKLSYREYFYTSVHHYSIADLDLMSNGQLELMLKSAVDFGASHIRACPLCSQKGFICEICSASDIIYPFEIDTTSQCDVCKTLFHVICFSPADRCPKCERRKKREEQKQDGPVEEEKEDEEV